MGIWGGFNVNQHYYSILIIAGLILFSIYRRVRRNIGWQELRKGNLVFRTILLLVVGLLFTTGSISHPISFISDIIGILIGVVLAYYSANITNFEQRDGRLYYRPNTWIGSTVTVIFLARLFYRFYSLYSQGGLSSYQQGQANSFQNMSGAMGNSWTAGLMLIMFAYYVIYYIFLLRKQKRMLQTD
jgi:hypothetical protein